MGIISYSKGESVEEDEYLGWDDGVGSTLYDVGMDALMENKKQISPSRCSSI